MRDGWVLDFDRERELVVIRGFGAGTYTFAALLDKSWRPSVGDTVRGALETVGLVVLRLSDGWCVEVQVLACGPDRWVYRRPPAWNPWWRHGG